MGIIFFNFKKEPHATPEPEEVISKSSKMESAISSFDSSSASSSEIETAISASPKSPMADFPGLAPNPLGSYQNRDESSRVLIRLYFDCLARPPTRSEFLAGLALTHEERWSLLRSRTVEDPPGRSSGQEHFQRILSRGPTSEEIEFLQKIPHDREFDLGIWLTATSEYRSSAHRRDKSIHQMAHSLMVDLLDQIPESNQAGSSQTVSFKELKPLEEAIQTLPDLVEISRTLANSKQQPENNSLLNENQIALEVFRFIQRYPGDKELALTIEEVKKHSEGLKWLRQTLVQTKEYRKY